MLSRASSTLPLLLDHTLRVLADVCSRSNCFTVAVHRLVAGEAGKQAPSTRPAITLTNILQAGDYNVRYSDGRSWYLVYALHRVCLSQNVPLNLLDIDADQLPAIALSPLAMDVIQYNLPTLPVSQRFLCFCL